MAFFTCFSGALTLAKQKTKKRKKKQEKKCQQGLLNNAMGYIWHLDYQILFTVIKETLKQYCRQITNISQSVIFWGKGLILNNK